MSAIDPAPADLPSRPGMKDALVAFRYPNFTRFFVGALLSNSGTWVQNVTVPFIVHRMTDSTIWLGLTGFLQFIPIALMGPIGGALADRFDRRSVLLVTQGAQAVVALAMWGAWTAGHQSLAIMMALVLLSGFITGINIPSWQAFVSELVPREVLLNAVTLNSAQFNASRLIGPALGGLVLGTLGESWAFLINGLSYLAVLGAVSMIKVPRLVKTGSVRAAAVVRGFVESMAYSRQRPGIMACFIAVAALGGLGSPLNQLLPVFASNVFHVSDFWYGVLAAAAGFGAVLATPLIAGRGSGSRRSRLIDIAMVSYGVAVFAFAVAPVYPLALVALAVTGAGYLAMASTLNTTIQIQVDEVMRGKVLALYVMVLTLALPLGVLLQGLLAQVVGPQVAVATFGLLFLGVFVWLRFVSAYLPHLDDERAAVA